MPPILRRQLRNCEQQISDTSVPLLKLLRNAEMSTRVHSTSKRQRCPRSDGSTGGATRRLCGSAWAYQTTGGHTAGPADLGHALSVQTEARTGFAITEEVMASQELLRNAKLRSAWEIWKRASSSLQMSEVGDE